MIMLITSDEDGARAHFYTGLDALMEAWQESLPTRWLSPAEAESDPDYWPEGAAFLAEVAPMRLEPKKVVQSWQLASLT